MWDNNCIFLLRLDVFLLRSSGPAIGLIVQQFVVQARAHTFFPSVRRLHLVASLHTLKSCKIYLLKTTERNEGISNGLYTVIDSASEATRHG